MLPTQETAALGEVLRLWGFTVKEEMEKRRSRMV